MKGYWFPQTTKYRSYISSNELVSFQAVFGEIGKHMLHLDVPGEYINPYSTIKYILDAFHASFKLENVTPLLYSLWHFLQLLLPKTHYSTVHELEFFCVCYFKVTGEAVFGKLCL